MTRAKLALLIGTGCLALVGGAGWLLRAQHHGAHGTGNHEVVPIAMGDAVWDSLQKRPLVLPALTPAQPCPVSRTAEVLPGQQLPGDGPIYPQLATDAGPIRYSGNQEGGWYYLKVLWRASGAYPGPALIRGRQLDGDQELRFGDGPTPSAELRFPVETGVRSSYTVDGWRDNPSLMRIRAPGCYAWQVDGLDFRTVIVFAAEP